MTEVTEPTPAEVHAKYHELPMLRQSERSAFKRCNWAWYQAYVKGLQPIVEKWKDVADFGTLFHMALAEYYLPGTKRGPHPAETWQTLSKDQIANIKAQEIVDDELVTTWIDFQQLGLELCDAYVKRYQGDPHWDVLDAERRFSVLIPDTRVARGTSKNGRRVYKPVTRLVGTFDLCYRDLNDGYVKMTDHKTVGRIETQHLELDEQASTYIAVATHALREQGLIGEKDVVKGMEFNFIKRAKVDVRQRDELGQARNKPVKRNYWEAFGQVPALAGVNVDKMKLDELANMAAAHGITVYGDVSKDQDTDNFKRFFVPRTAKERQRQIVRISEEAQVMDEIRNGHLPILKTVQKDCCYCKFFDLCCLDESGEDTSYFIETTMKKHDPYFDHRDGADNSKKVGGEAYKPQGQTE